MKTENPRNFLDSPKLTYLSAILTGLLSSSCCIIQLVFNIFSIGCAGFSILTPYRPIFLSFTTILIITTITRYGLKSRRALITILISLFLCISPELVAFYNQGNIPSTQKFFSVNLEKEVFLLEIYGISCEGCTNRIKNYFDSKPNVIESKVFFENQSAIVSVVPGTYEVSDFESWVKIVDFRYTGKVIQRYITS
ncbi:1474_t:CDS:1 [Acaulospora morrowiae]|uniref:1474_t:CDS:1 n=1 Tax=Acaulospora morrowiae TaxID=94023 RepID=A0A9N8ZVK9_9GLOM|nr:1474_t:CDS:1 [Acaulospora morrowiae]